MADPKKNAIDLSFDAISLGAEAAFPHCVTAEDVLRFAALTGDYNPLHLDEEYAHTTRFDRCIVHGMLLAGLFSRLVGMHLPGRNCLYLSQSADFVHPVYAGDNLLVTGSVLQKQEATRSLVIRTRIQNSSGDTVVRGKAHVQILDNR